MTRVDYLTYIDRGIETAAIKLEELLANYSPSVLMNESTDDTSLMTFMDVLTGLSNLRAQADMMFK